MTCSARLRCSGDCLALSQCTVFMASGRWRSKVVVFSLLVRAYALSFVLGCKLLRLAFLTTKPSYAYTLGLCGREWGSGARLGRPSQVSATRCRHLSPPIFHYDRRVLVGLSKHV